MRLYASRADVRAWLTERFGSEWCGRDGARTLAAIQAEPGCPRQASGEPLTGRQVRQAIADLVNLDHLPIIGDSQAGYYLCRSREELERGLLELHDRAMAMLVRRRELYRYASEHLDGQMPLDLELADRIVGHAMSMLGSVPTESPQ